MNNKLSMPKKNNPETPIFATWDFCLDWVGLQYPKSMPTFILCHGALY